MFLEYQHTCLSILKTGLLPGTVILERVWASDYQGKSSGLAVSRWART
jgi:hypothetical protein